MISTNAGGMEAFRHGVMRHRVLGLEVVLPDGSIMSDMAQVTKSNEGYDLKQLFIGAEGTLGVITRAVVRLAPGDEFTATALVACPSATDAVALFQSLQRNRGLNLLRAEFMARDYFALASASSVPLPSLPSPKRLPISSLKSTRADQQTGAISPGRSAGRKRSKTGLVVDAILAQSEKERSEIWNIREDSNVVTRSIRTATGSISPFHCKNLKPG